jgi:hypothetical protein
MTGGGGAATVTSAALLARLPQLEVDFGYFLGIGRRK